MTLPQWITARPGAAIRCTRGLSWSLTDLAERSSAFISLLDTAKARGRAVGLLADNCADWIATDPATHAHGSTLVPLAYHLIDRGNPVGFFGMVHVPEGTSAAIASRAAEGIRTALALPASAFTYLSSHGTLDAEHVRGFAALIDRLEEAADRTAVLDAARAFCHLYGNVLRSLPGADAVRERQAA